MKRENLRGARTMAAVAAVVALAGSAQAVTIDFNTLQHGEVVNSQFVGQGLTISAENFSKPFDLAIIFDANENGTEDPDLEGPPWAQGNLAPNTDLSKMLIISENNVDGNGDGLIDRPDDEGGNPAGKFTLQFSGKMTEFGFDMVDIEGTATENGYIRFWNGAVSLGTIPFNDLTNNASPYYDPTIDFGDNSANRISPFSFPNGFDKVEIRLGGSGAIDNLYFVPSPGAAAMLGMAGLMGLRRRR